MLKKLLGSNDEVHEYLKHIFVLVATLYTILNNPCKYPYARIQIKLLLNVVIIIWCKSLDNTFIGSHKSKANEIYNL